MVAGLDHLEDIIQHQALGLQNESQGKLQQLLRKNMMTHYLMAHSSLYQNFLILGV